MSNKEEITREIAKIATPAELRSVLLQTMVNVLEGRTTVAQANSAIGCSVEIHKSIKQEWDMREDYASGAITIEGGVVRRLLGSDE